MMRAQYTTTLLLALVMAAGWGCDDGGSDSGAIPGEDAGAGGSGAGGSGAGGSGTGGSGAGGSGAGGTDEQALTARAAGRMSIEQIRRSIPIVTDGLEWTEDFGQGEVQMLDILAPTLGVPDYLLVTEENLEPGLLIAKFMQDMSHRICTRWVARDQSQGVDARSLVQHEAWGSTDEALVKANLRALQLRFFSRHVAPDDDGPIADLYELFVNASATAPEGKAAEDGWLSVCIALMTDPAFIIY